MIIDRFKVEGVNVVNIHSPGDNCFFGIAILNGANKETPEVAGVAHFAEHMCFKGTRKRNYKEINRCFALLGASPNAWTAGDEVAYHCTFPKDSFAGITEIMMDNFFNATIPEEEIESERQVILEERKMYDDNHGAFFTSAIFNKLFTWDKGHDELGTRETISSIQRKDIVGHLNRTTNINNFVIIIAGDIDSKVVSSEIRKHLPDMHEYLKGGSKSEVEFDMWSDYALSQNGDRFIVPREGITQSNVKICFEGLPISDEFYHTQKILMGVLGGGMYSMLFNRIREELGLCYSVGGTHYFVSYPNHYLLGVGGLTSTSNVDLFLEEVDNVFKSVLKNGIEDELFQCAKMSILSGMLATLETALGKASITMPSALQGYDMQFEPDILNKIRNVTKEECEEVAEVLLRNQMHHAIMSPA